MSVFAQSPWLTAGTSGLRIGWNDQNARCAGVMIYAGLLSATASGLPAEAPGAAALGLAAEAPGAASLGLPAEAAEAA